MPEQALQEPQQKPVYYLQTQRVLKEEYNGEGETTIYIAGRICKEGEDDFEECVLIWDGNMNGE